MSATKTILEHCCLKCHFLAWTRKQKGWEQARVESTLESVPESERRRFTEQPQTIPPERYVKRDQMSGSSTGGTTEVIYSFRCFMGAWKQRPKKENTQSLWTRERGESCFFFAFTPELSLEAAKELERREANRREAERDRALTRDSLGLTRESLRLTRRTSWVAVCALIVTILVAIANIIVNILASSMKK